VEVGMNAVNIPMSRDKKMGLVAHDNVKRATTRRPDNRLPDQTRPPRWPAGM
jgi:hypothetical protein